MTRPALRAAVLVALAAGLAASISLAEAALAALAIAGIVGLARRRQDLTALPLALPIVAFVGWSLIAALVSARPLESLAEAKSALWLSTIWIVALALPDRPAVRRWLVLLGACVAVVAALSIVQVVACPVSPPPWPVLGRFFRKCGRAHGFFSIYMTLAGVLMMVLAAVLPSLVVSPRLRAVGVAGWIVGVIAFGLTNVRGAWIGLLAGVFVGAVAARRRLALRLAAAVLVLAAIAAVPNVLERVRSPGPRWVLDDTARDRLAMLAGGLRMIADRPVTGVGPGQVKRVYPDYAPPEALRRATSHLHDTPLQIAVERGIVGLALWLALFAAFYARAVAIYRRVDDDEDRAMVAGVLAAITSFLIAGLFEYNFGDTEVLLVACALMALPFAIDRPAPRS